MTDRAAFRVRWLLVAVAWLNAGVTLVEVGMTVVDVLFKTAPGAWHHMPMGWRRSGVLALSLAAFASRRLRGSGVAPFLAALGWSLSPGAVISLFWFALIEYSRWSYGGWSLTVCTP